MAFRHGSLYRGGMDTILLLAPDFALIFLGVGLRRHGGLGDGFWLGLERLVYFVLFPALLFNALARSHIDWLAMMPLLITGMVTMISGLALGALLRPLAGLSPMGFASRLQCGFRFNTYVGIAIAGKVQGAAGIAAMGALCGAMVPLANLLAVGLMARRGQGRVWRELSRNPLVLATLAGLIFNLLGWALPVPVGQFLQRLADASIALGLLAVGAALRVGQSQGPWPGSAGLVGIKLLGLPLVAWGVGRGLGLEGPLFQIAVLFAALPSASSAYILATRMGGDGPGVAWLISATTLGAMVSLPGWLSLLQLR